MAACLTNQDLEVYVAGSATPEPMSAWTEHLDGCDACAARLARKAAVRTVPPGSDPDGNPGSGSAEAVTIKPPADAALDAGAGLPEDAVLGYRTLKELHRGVQEPAKRKVALEEMLEGPFASEDSKRRSEREIALVGSLRHPGIVPSFESGAAQGRFYYAMAYIRGEPLNEHAQSRRLFMDDTLRLFKKVCDAACMNPEQARGQSCQGIAKGRQLSSRASRIDLQEGNGLLGHSLRMSVFASRAERTTTITDSMRCNP